VSPNAFHNEYHSLLLLLLSLGCCFHLALQVTVLYNLVQEPWLKYCMSAVADRGLKSSHWTSSRLREDVLYLESSRWGQRQTHMHVCSSAKNKKNSLLSAHRLLIFYLTRASSDLFCNSREEIDSVTWTGHPIRDEAGGHRAVSCAAWRPAGAACVPLLRPLTHCHVPCLRA
jgi:hypothetical protein